MDRDSIEVTKKDIEEFKKESGIALSFETSAKENMNVSMAFDEIANQSFQLYMKKKSNIKTPLSAKPIQLEVPIKE